MKSFLEYVMKKIFFLFPESYLLWLIGLFLVICSLESTLVSRVHSVRSGSGSCAAV